MVLLKVRGGVTKTFKSYGKAKSNTTSKALTLWDQDDETPTSATSSAISSITLSSSSSSSSDDDSDSDGSVIVATPPASPGTRRRIEKERNRQHALSAIKDKRNARGGPLPLPPPPAVGATKAKGKGKNVLVEDDKENLDSSSCESPIRRPVFVKSRARPSRFIVHSPVGSVVSTRGLVEKKESEKESAAEGGRNDGGKRALLGDKAGRLAPSPLRLSSVNNQINASTMESDSLFDPLPARTSNGRRSAKSSASDNDATHRRRPLGDVSSERQPKRRSAPAVPQSISKNNTSFYIDVPPSSARWRELEGVAAVVRQVEGRRSTRRPLVPTSSVVEDESDVESGRRTSRSPTSLISSNVIALSDDDEEGDEPTIRVKAPSSPTSSELSFKTAPDLSASTTLSISVRASTRLNPLPFATYQNFPASLLPLLATSDNPTAALDFTSFVQHPPSPFLPQKDFCAYSNWPKIGEASFSEVFSTIGGDGERLVIKIVPVSAGESEEFDSTMPFMSEASSVMREIEISKLLGEGNDGFVQYKGAFIVQGAYPEILLQEWDAFKRAQRSPDEQQIRPHVLPNNQVYAIICLAHAGSDLEHFRLKSWKDALSVLLQVATIISKGEENFQLEHRDLHWGNILVRPKDLAAELSSMSLKPSSSTAGRVEVTVIDFTLSRATTSEGNVLFDAFEDEEIFEGEGDRQFDIYRLMRDYIGAEWEDFHPLTNLMWLHYVALKLLHFKKLKIPSQPTTSAPPPSPFRAVVRPTARGRGKHLGPSSTTSTSLPSREEVIAYETLVRLEKALEAVVDHEMEERRTLRGEKSRGRGKGKGKAKSSKKGKELLAIEGASEGLSWRSASEFMLWLESSGYSGGR